MKTINPPKTQREPTKDIDTETKSRETCTVKVKNIAADTDEHSIRDFSKTVEKLVISLSWKLKEFAMQYLTLKMSNRFFSIDEEL